MNKRTVNKLDYLVITGLALLTLVLIYTPDVPIFKAMKAYSVHVMFGFLIFGLIMLMLKRERLLFSGFICSGILAMFLMNNTGSKLKYIDESALPKLSVMMVDLSGIGQSQIIMDKINELEPDVICLKEYTPVWKALVTDSLGARFKHVDEEMRIDPLGSVLVSKYPIVDKKLSDDGQVHEISIEKQNDTVVIYALNLVPSFQQFKYKEAASTLGEIASDANQQKKDVFVIGNFNLSPWSEEVLKFRFDVDLRDSRRDNNSLTDQGTKSLFRIPTRHILYSEGYDCLQFIDLVDNNGVIGVYGKYQMR